MSQRGGEVQSHMRISDSEIASDLVSQGKADMIISVEPMEALRYLPWLSPDGWLITNTTPFVNIPNYPPIDQVLGEVKKLKNHIMVDADTIAKDLGSPKSANMVILGAASHHLAIPYEKLEEAIRSMFGRKGEEIVNTNLKALKAGRDAV